MTLSPNTPLSAENVGLLSCPFCGSASVQSKHPEVPDMVIVGCIDPDCAGHQAAYDFVDLEAAANYWNRRPALSPPAEGEMDMAFGFGRFVVDTGCYQQKPAVFICPVEQPGEIGASARHLGHDRHTLLPGERVLTFPTVDQAQSVADALVGSAATPTPAPVDWTVVGPKLVALIERVDAERKRETVRLNHLKRAVAAVAAEARAALAAAQPGAK